MLCECCFKKIIPKRTIFNLFEIETHHICELCYMKQPMIPHYQVVPIEQGKIMWYNLCKEEVIYPVAYMSFLKTYVLTFMTYHKKDIFLYTDQLTESLLNILDSLKLGNVFLVSLCEKIDKKENNDEI